MGSASSAPLVSGAAASASGVASVQALLRELGQLRGSGAAAGLDLTAPLAHFVQLVLLALERRAPAMLAWLVTQYEPRLRDPALRKYVTVVQQRLGLEMAATVAPANVVSVPSCGCAARAPATPAAVAESTIDEND